MQRREFIKASGTVLAATTLPTASALALAPESRTRSVLFINRKWRFHPAKVEGAHLPEFNDAKFEAVVIPHTNVTLPWHNFARQGLRVHLHLSPPFQVSRRGKGQTRLRRLRRRYDRVDRLDQRRRPRRISRRLHTLLSSN